MTKRGDRLYRIDLDAIDRLLAGKARYLARLA